MMARMRLFRAAVLSFALLLAALTTPAALAQDPPSSPPAPSLTADADGDRVPDPEDACPATRPRSRTVAAGCSLVQAFTSPGVVFGESIAKVREATDELTGGAFRSARRGALAGIGRMGLAVRQVAAGNSCAARSGLQAAGSSLRSSVLGTLRKVRREQSRLTGRARGGDFDEAEAGALELELRQTRAKEASAATNKAAAIAKALCAAEQGDASVRGTVKALDRSGIALLADGTQVLFGRASGVPPVRGAQIVVKGKRLSGKTLVAASIRGTLEKAAEFVPECRIRVRFTPPGLDSDHFAYRSEAYRDGATYLLEKGMTISSDQLGACGAGTPIAQARLEYTSSTGAKLTSTTLVHPGWAQHLVPSDADPTKPAKLTVTRYVAKCAVIAGKETCVYLDAKDLEVAAADIEEAGGFGSVTYDKTLFTVESGTFDYELAQATTQAAPRLPGAVFSGWGFVQSGAGTTYPELKNITLNQSFAVHDGWTKGLAHGWFVGSRNGHGYAHTAKLPDIVTDAVALCPGQTEHSYYRLPWKYGTTASTPQGNNGGFTHKGGQAFAWDFVMPNLDPIYATRGGIVEKIDDDEHRNRPKWAAEYKKKHGTAPPDDHPDIPRSNHLVIKHQDGLYTFYAHFPKGGISKDLKVGGRVIRGQFLGSVGETGNATGPHLHYHVTKTGGVKGTVQSRFQVGTSSNGGIAITDCVIPATNSVWTSTNKIGGP